MLVELAKFCVGLGHIPSPPPWKIFDVNDHAPLITNCPSASSSASPCVFSVRLPEDHPLGLSLATVSARDADAGPNARLSYSLRPFGRLFSSASLFSVDSLHGNISLRRPLDFEQSDWHRVWVCVQDAGIPPRSTEVLLEVFVEVNFGDG